MRRFGVWVLISALIALAALALSAEGCSSEEGSAPTPDTALDDSGSPETADADEVALDARSETYPAFHPPMPTVLNSRGNPVLGDFTVVPVIFASDTSATIVTDFLAKYAASPEWTTQVKEYGVGKFTVATTIVLSESAPSTLTDAALDVWLRDKLDGTHPEWGPTDPVTLSKTVFALIFPASTVITHGGGTSCVDFRGYHNASVPKTDAGVPDVGDGAVGTDVPILYAMVPHCKPLAVLPELTEAEVLTTGLAHEIQEAATSPLTGLLKPSFNEIDSAHLVWRIAFGGAEITDLCNVRNSFWAPPSIGYKIARSWSNVSASAYHDPCVPSPDGEPYFNSYIDPIDTVRFASGGTTTKGINLAVGTPRTVDVLLFSDRPTAPWGIVQVREILMPTNKDPVLTLSLDGKNGSNGDVLSLTVTASARPPSGVTMIAIYSQLGTKGTGWYTAVGVK